MKVKITYSEYTNTFRLMPFNYWLASIKNNKLIFDSWDGMTKQKFKRNPLLKLRIRLIYLKMRLTNKL